ncbi:Bacterial regulatory protein, ArsR domain protein [Candidatus Desulfofervidus auxilii]|uniref:Bacterial regulatory protein, ArsR domain protein n=1 Tax=Desulfofervidus auxilii TaxID=1621989 RepID=A0A7U4QLG5_DESA2|nr:metalloregulator ArsR/SmtB family transcription factor [Candidatus Desulfofervidus auxilii]AMM41535.1 Bacterial regulatory protein, ArsR domain protein [Candidatus Desulfofervidus auxilii]
MGEGLKKWIKAFKALGDESRLKMLACIAKKKELCVCELQALLKLSQPTVSRHLRILEEADFLESRRQGQWVIYTLKENKISSIFLKLIDEISKEDELKDLIEKARKINLRD